MTRPLMPMATAVWLVDNTTLTFRQIAKFCELHPLEVQGIADETVGLNIVGLDPTLNAQLTNDEIKRCQDDASQTLEILLDEVPATPRTTGPRYTPVSKRKDKPDAIAWLIRNHGELSDAQIGRLVGTTKPTIAGIRDRSHWNIQNITPNDPVALGLCTQIELDEAVGKGMEREERKQKKADRAAAKAAKADTPATAPAEIAAPAETATITDADDVAETTETTEIAAPSPEVPGEVPGEVPREVPGEVPGPDATPEATTEATATTDTGIEPAPEAG